MPDYESLQPDLEDLFECRRCRSRVRADGSETGGQHPLHFAREPLAQLRSTPPGRRSCVGEHDRIEFAEVVGDGPTIIVDRQHPVLGIEGNNCADIAVVDLLS